jgi:hypothetical protein
MANTTGFDVICFIHLMRTQTLQELAKLCGQPLELPEMPCIVTVCVSLSFLGFGDPSKAIKSPDFYPLLGYG